MSFVIPFLGIAGGIRAVFEIADRLRERGHETAIVVPRRSVLSRRNDLLRALRGAASLVPPRAWRENETSQDWFPLRTPVIPIADLRPGLLPEADATVVSSWQTAERAWPLAERCGVPFYYLQHYEVWSGEASRVDATWRLPYRRIASSAWLVDLGRQRFGIADMGLVVYGVNRAMFHPDPGPRPPRPCLRVGMLYHRSAWKGNAEGFEAVRRVRGGGIPLELVLFGVFPPGQDVPPGAEFHFDPRGETLRRLYASLDVFLCPSREETGPMTVTEAMACGAAIVSTDVGNVRVWSGEGRAALLSPPGDAGALAANLGRVLSDTVLREELALEGARRIREFTWERAAGEFERFLLGETRGA